MILKFIEGVSVGEEGVEVRFIAGGECER